MVESFWSKMQVELFNRKKWNTRIELANAIFDYIEILSRYAGDPVCGRRGRAGLVTALIGDLLWCWTCVLFVVLEGVAVS